MLNGEKKRGWPFLWKNPAYTHESPVPSFIIIQRDNGYLEKALTTV